MGRLEKRKGVYDLISAASAIIKNFKNARFIICGDGEVERVRYMVKEKKLNDNIEIFDWVVDKERFFSAADIYVLPSYNEGLPMSVLEAASYELPVVSTKVGGIPEIIEDEVSGFLIEPGDVFALQTRIELLINSKILREYMGKKALDSVKERFEHNLVMNQVDNLYQELLS